MISFNTSLAAMKLSDGKQQGYFVEDQHVADWWNGASVAVPCAGWPGGSVCGRKGQAGYQSSSRSLRFFMD